MKNKIIKNIGHYILLVALLLVGCSDPEIEVVKVPIDQPVYDTMYVCPNQDKPLHFTNYDFDLNPGTASYELEFYRYCYTQSGTFKITFNTTGGNDQPLEIIFYNGYTVVHSTTFFLNGEDQTQDITPPYFDSIRMKLTNGTEDQLNVSISDLKVTRL